MGMFQDGVNCDIYIGKGAGSKLMKDMQDARRSIKIVSPYLSPFLIKELISLKSKGVEVQLITVDNIEDYYGSYDKNIYQLIRQHRYLDENAQNKRNKLIKYSRILLLLSFLLLSIVIALSMYNRNSEYLAGLIPILFMFLVYLFFRNRIKNKRIYTYSYSQLFPFKVYMSPEKHALSDMFIHGKIYLIDDSIVYLGSLNFTGSGTKQNYETRIRTTDTEAVKKIKDEFYGLFYHANIPEINIQNWGKLLYKEPIN